MVLITSSTRRTRLLVSFPPSSLSASCHSGYVLYGASPQAHTGNGYPVISKSILLMFRIQFKLHLFMMCALLPGSSLPIWGVGKLYHGCKPGSLTFYISKALLEYKPTVSHAVCDVAASNYSSRIVISATPSSQSLKYLLFFFLMKEAYQLLTLLFSKYGFLECYHKCHLGTRILQSQASHQGCQKLRGQNSVI